MLSARAPRWSTAPIPLDPLTERIVVRLPRGKHWRAQDRFRLTIVINADGTPFRASAEFTGGPRRSRASGLILPYSGLVYAPPWGFLGSRRGPAVRLGQLCDLYSAHLEFEWLGGIVEPELLLETRQRAVEYEGFHNSVAFDTATDAQESAGDGVLSLTHTAGGSDRLAIGVAVNTDFVAGIASTSMTYGGVGMTEMWDVQAASFWGNAGYRLVAPATGAQTVTSTLAASVGGDHLLGVISLTGVDQTTPVGTPATGNNTDATATVTPAGAAADDLVVDGMVTGYNGTLTVGADQTTRNTEDGAQGVRLRMSTQPGTAGGVMSWTLGGTDPFGAGWLTGAVVVKAAPGGPTTEQTMAAMNQFTGTGGMIGRQWV